MTVSFHPIAERELREAAQYYELESAGLGDAFLNEVERSCGLIVDHPQSAPIVSGSIRRKLVRRFPYALLYSIQADSFRVLAVMSLKRRPNYVRDSPDAYDSIHGKRASFKQPTTSAIRDWRDMDQSSFNSLTLMRCPTLGSS